MSQLALTILGLAALSYATADATSDATSSSFSPRGVITDPVAFSAITFDYVVVGAGNAGLPVAARLADAGKKVGVIEAGLFRYNDALIDTPNFFGHALGNASVDWAFFSVPQPKAGNRPVFQPRGKILGGSTALNFMAYQRASAADYDGWTQLGNPHWSWPTLLPYFKKAETYTPERPDQRFPGAPPTTSNSVSQFEGDCGPIKATFNDFYSDLGTQYVKAVNNIGIPTNPTPDYGNATGIFNSPESIDRETGKRSYATEYYLKDSPRSNLVILTGAQATQVLFKDGTSSGKVVANRVQFVVGGKKYTVKANKEVILSAGSFQTPQLLELSGIGQSALLKNLKIPVRVDLPGVGENLQDHIYAPQDYEVKPGHHTFDELRNDPAFAAQALLQYQTQHNGILAAVPAPYSFVSFNDAASPEQVKSYKAKLDADLAANPPTTDLQKAQFKIQRKWLDTDIGNVEVIFIPGVFSTPNPGPGKSYISIVTTVQHPFSRGTVHINTTDPFASPLIDPKYLSRDHDLDALRSVFKLGQKIAKTAPFSDLLVGMSAPDPNTIKTDAQLDTYLRGALSPVFHPIGTAAMAPREIGGVVNEELVVYGTKNLRVVDASVIPLHIAAHPQESIYALAEKAADIILSGAA